MNKFKQFDIGGEKGVFDIVTPPKRFNANTVKFGGKYRYVVRSDNNNGIRGYITEDEKYLSPANTISFGQDTATMFFQNAPYFTGDKIKIFKLRNRELTREIAIYLIAVMKKAFITFAWGRTSFNVKVLEAVKISLPVTASGDIDFPFMENRIRELELARIRELVAYLKVTGLTDYQLTTDEKKFLENYHNIPIEGGKRYRPFRLVELFGPSTRGKRLKSLDRVDGTLPFVTAGEKDTGISASVGNDVEVFQSNTITIDMFGSAKYRNYCYGADDHVAVVHTENIEKNAVVFITAAIHKVSYNSLWNYSNNFYAKDADSLIIHLPVTAGGKPDYEYMTTFISIQQKLAIKSVVEWKDKELKAYKSVTAS